MAQLNIPAGYQRVMPYLILNDALGFFNWTQTVFGATEKMKHLAENGTIQHAEIQIGDSTIMIGGGGGGWGPDTGAFFIYVENADESYQKALDNGATSLMPVSDQPYGRSGGVKDPYGNTWWITNPL